MYYTEDTLGLEIRNHHQAPHSQEEDHCMENETIGRRRTHGVRHLKESAEQRLRKLVRLGIGHNEEYQRRNEGVFGLQHSIEHVRFLLLDRVNLQGREILLLSESFLLEHGISVWYRWEDEVPNNNCARIGRGVCIS